MTKHSLIISGVLLLCNIGLVSLSAQKLPSEYAKLYPHEYMVGLELLNHTTISLSKGELEIQEEVSKTRLYMDKRATEFAQMSIEYEPTFSEIESLNAYTLVPDDEKDTYKKMKVSGIEDKKLISDDVFHDGTRAKVFTFPAVKKGAITTMNYTQRINNPFLVGYEVFQMHYLIEKQEFILESDEDIEIDIHYVNCTEADFNYSIEQKNGMRIQRWQMLHQQKLHDEDNMPPFLHLAPHIIYRIKSYEYKGESKPILQDVADLHHNYRQYIQELSRDDHESIAALADSITQGARSDREKVDIIYRWMQDNVKYVAFEEGLGGFVPRPPSKVMNRKYGDCKDMSCLMVHMLREVDIPAYYTWIGTRKIPYTYHEVPSSLSDNHMIATVKLDDELIFLDATSQSLPFPLPSAFIQGKEALIDFGQDSFLVKEVPVVPASINKSLDSLTLTLDHGVLKGTGRRSYHGYFMTFLNDMENRKNGKLNTERLENDVSKGSNKCASQILEVRNLGSHGIVDYELSIPDYVFSDQNSLYLNLNLEKILADMKLKKDRTYPLNFDHTFHFERYYSLEIPDSYTISSVPEDLHFSRDGMNADIEYQLKANKIIYQLKIQVNLLKVEPDRFEDFNAFIKSLSNGYSNSISLEK